MRCISKAAALTPAMLICALAGQASGQLSYDQPASTPYISGNTDAAIPSLTLADPDQTNTTLLERDYADDEQILDWGMDANSDSTAQFAIIPGVTSDVDAQAGSFIHIDGDNSAQIGLTFRAESTVSVVNGFDWDAHGTSVTSGPIVINLDTAAYAPGTSLTLTFDWSYDADASVNPEALTEDAARASGFLRVETLDAQNQYFNNFFISGVGLPETGTDAGQSTLNLTADGSVVPIAVDFAASAVTEMLVPGLPDDTDAETSHFQGQLTITVAGAQLGVCKTLAGCVADITADQCTGPDAVFEVGGICCRADISGDGVISVGDILDYLALWSTGDLLADFSGDGVISVGDILDFLAEWSNGC